MAMPMSAYELEAFPELEGEFEGAWEGELEGDFESEEFFRSLAGLARQAIQSPALRRVGLTAARTALRGLGDLGGAIGGAFGPAGTAIDRRLGTQAGGYLSGWLPQSDFEGEFEWELNGGLSPLRRLYPQALMEHLGHAAAQAESEAEAEAFLGALVPLAARLIPQVAPAIMRAAPGLIRGVSGIGQTLLRSPATKPLVRAVPTIVRQTAANLAQQVAQGQPVSPQTAVRTLARQTARVLSSPQQCVQAYRRSRAMDGRHHRAAGVVGRESAMPY